MVRPTKEELYYFYCILDMKQSEIEKHFSYKNISRLLDNYNIPKKKRGHFSKMTTDELIKKFKQFRKDNGEFYDYSEVNYINQKTKITIICPIHGKFKQFPRDHLNGYSGCKKCSKKARDITNLNKYGAKCVFQSEKVKDRIRNTCLEKYGVENPSQLPEIQQKKIKTSLKNYGVEYPMQSKIIKEKSKQTNLEKYGVPFAMKLPKISQKSVETRFEKNNYIKSTGSNESKKFIRNYINQKGYDLSQCAFSDEEYDLYEWGYQYKGRWILYDLVVFERGFRGDKTKIIEILEYHGPFHYTKKDVLERGDEKAFPWKSKTMTIRESYYIDCIKEEFAKSLTKNYNVIWVEKYHKNKNSINT